MVQLALGTAQFGQDYGVKSPEGELSSSEIERILQTAKSNGVGLLDTAAAYGTSEQVLGRHLDQSNDFHIVTKTIPVESNKIKSRQVEAVRERFEESLRHLGERRLYGLLVHHAGDLLKEGGEQLWEGLRQIHRDGHVRKIGVSVYRPQTLEVLLERYDLDLVQLPLNVFDQRFAESGLLERLSNSRIEVHARSIFLQGVLLSTPEELPSWLAPLSEKLLNYREHVENKGLSPHKAAIQYVRVSSGVDYAVIGVDSAKQLKQNAQAFGTEEVSGMGWTDFSVPNEALVNPARWSELKS